MALLNFKNKDNEWETLYGQALNDRLDKDQNLADLTNKKRAVENLELVGKNNITHNHDSQYKTLIDQEASERKQGDEDIMNMILQESTDSKEKLKELRKKRKEHISELLEQIYEEKGEKEKAIFLLRKYIKDEIAKKKLEIINKIEQIMVSVPNSTQVAETDIEHHEYVSGDINGHIVGAHEQILPGIKEPEEKSLKDIIVELAKYAHLHQENAPSRTKDSLTLIQKKWTKGVRNLVGGPVPRIGGIGNCSA